MFLKIVPRRRRGASTWSRLRKAPSSCLLKILHGAKTFPPLFLKQTSCHMALASRGVTLCTRAAVQTVPQTVLTGARHGHPSPVPTGQIRAELRLRCPRPKYCNEVNKTSPIMLPLAVRRLRPVALCLFLGIRPWWEEDLGILCLLLEVSSSPHWQRIGRCSIGAAPSHRSYPRREQLRCHGDLIENPTLPGVAHCIFSCCGNLCLYAFCRCVCNPRVC